MPIEYAIQNEQALVDLTLDLLRFDTQNPPGETTRTIDWMEAYFDALGIETDRVTVEQDKPNLIARLPGETDRTLLYVGHLDTVPFNATAW